MPGAEDLLRHLKGNGVNIALATSSDRKNYVLKTSRHIDLFGLFDHIFTGDMVAKGKPNPEIFLKAANAFDPPAKPENCLVFEVINFLFSTGHGAVGAVRTSIERARLPHRRHRLSLERIQMGLTDASPPACDNSWRASAIR